MRALLTALLISATLAATHAAEALQRFVFEKAEMGVPFRITLYATNESVAEAAANAAFARVEALNSLLSDYDPDSELSRLSFRELNIQSEICFEVCLLKSLMKADSPVLPSAA